MDESYPPPSALASETVNDLFAVLSNEKCRHVIQYFCQKSRSVTAFENLMEYSVQQADDNVNQEKRAIALHHVALPKLADAGVLDYNTSDNTVQYHGWPAAEQLVVQPNDRTGQHDWK